MIRLLPRKTKGLGVLFVLAIGLAGLIIYGVLEPQRKESVIKASAEMVRAEQKTAFFRDELANKFSSLAVPFVPNSGQFPEQVRFQAPLLSGSFFLTEDSLVYSLLKDEEKKPAAKEAIAPERLKPELKSRLDKKAKLIAFREIFVDKKGQPIKFRPEGEEKAVTRVSYFKGNSPAEWKTGLTTYNSISMGEIYPGIELKLKAKARNVEKIFCLAPGVSPENIRIKLEGIESIALTPEGKLALETAEGPIHLSKPAAYQEAGERKVEVKVQYVVYEGNSYGFRADAYDQTLPLVIDPAIDTLLASTFLGGSGNDGIVSARLDHFGNVYVSGSTQSADFPAFFGVHQLSSTGAQSVFIACLSSNLDTLQSAAFLEGGTCYVMEIAGGGNVYVGGYATSSNFPVTPGAYDTSFNTLFKAFISKLDSSLTNLLASTFLGGSSFSYQTVHSIAFDASGNVYVAGETGSEDFPVTSGAFQTVLVGSQEGFISKFDSSLSTLLVSTFLGGNGLDYVYAIALDRSSNIYAAGTTDSPDFPITPGAFRTERISEEAFVSHLSGDLSTLLASTYLGGSGYDYGYAIVLDGNGNVCIAGETGSYDFPVTPEAFKKKFKDETISETDGFVSILSGDLKGLVASTLLGGSAGDECRSITIDGAGKIYVAGTTSSVDFPVTWGSYDLSYNGGVIDFFISRFNPALSVLEASTYFDGSGTGGRGNIVLDGKGNIIIAGITCSSDFPITPGAYDTTFGGESEGFISKLIINEKLIDVDVTIDTSPSGLSINVDGVTYNAPQTFRWTEGTEHAIGVPSPQGEALAGLKRTTTRILSSRRLKIPVADRKSVINQNGESGTRYVFSSWSDEGSQSHTITVRTSTWKYTAFFDKQYTLTTAVNPLQGGTVTPSGTSWVKEGTTVQVTATPNPGYKFSGWSGDVVSNASTISIVMDNPKSLTANFVPIIYYPLTTSANPPEGGAVIPAGTNQFEEGTVVQVVAIPNPDYLFYSWSGDNTSRARVISVTMNGPKTLVANFLKNVAYPPKNVQLQRLENNMVFYKEYVNRLSWQPNEQNVIKVLKYRIYYKPKESADDNYRVLAEVYYSTLQYDHRGLKKEDLYTYRITSVNIYGVESSFVEVGN